MEINPVSSIESLKEIINTVNELKPQFDQILQIPMSELHSSSLSGISLLDLKNQMLSSYLQNLINLLIIRISHTCGLNLNQSSTEEKNSSNQIVEQLTWLRLVFEKIRPIESRLKYQIDKLIKTVEELDHPSFSNQDAVIDHIVNDPLSFKPNPAALEAPDGAEDQDQNVNEEEFYGKETQDAKPKSVYKPPRVAPVIYPEPSHGKSKRIAPAPTALREHISLSATAPLPESTTGLSNSAAKASNRAKALERMKQYEETNMTRLFSSKKDARRRRNDEAAIALGVQTSSSNKNMKRKLGALEGEFDGVLNDINRKTDRYSDHLGSTKTVNKKKTSNLKSNGVKSKKGAFDKAIKKLPK